MNNVVHLVRWCLPFTASFIRNQIVYHERYEPGIVFTQPRKGAFYEDIEEKAATHYPLRSGLGRKLYRFTRQLTPAAKNRVKSFIRHQQPKVLHVHYGVDCLVYAAILRDLKIPACVSFYGYDCTSFPTRFYGFGKMLLKRNVFFNPAVKAILAMSQDMKADLIKAGCPEEKIIVHYYGTETRLFYMERSAEEKEVIRFLIISGFHPKKGHRYLIDAFVAMSRAIDRRIELHIVGDGPLRLEIEERIAASGLSNIYLHGPVRYGSAEHRAHFRDADVFVHPSVVSGNGDKEGIPGAIIEAMAAGLPVVATYHAGIPEIIGHDVTGVLVPEKDTKALQAAMTKLATDKDLRARIGRQGQIHAAENLDVVAKEKELEEIYDKLS